jgi:hypothetical protein
VAGLLKPFGIKPDKWRGAYSKIIRGYHRSNFEDAFSRYLDGGSATSATALNSDDEIEFPSATDVDSVADGKQDNVNNFYGREREGSGLPVLPRFHAKKRDEFDGRITTTAIRPYWRHVRSAWLKLSSISIDDAAAALSRESSSGSLP